MGGLGNKVDHVVEVLPTLVPDAASGSKIETSLSTWVHDESIKNVGCMETIPAIKNEVEVYSGKPHNEREMRMDEGLIENDVNKCVETSVVSENFKNLNYD